MSLFNKLFGQKSNETSVTRTSHFEAAIKGNNNQSSSADFVRNSKKKKVGIKSALMEHSAKERGLKTERFNSRILYVETPSGEKLAFSHMNGPDSSRVGMNICDNKIHTRKLLRKNEIVVVKSKSFKHNQFEQAKEFVQKIDGPVVVKPISLSRGRGITTNIQNEQQLEDAWNKAFDAYKTKKSTRTVLIEQQFNGYDYRVFVIKDRVISVTQRRRANVVGDGKSTIIQLIEKKNEERLQNPYLQDYLIPTDIKVMDQLQNQQLTLDFVPKKGELITLRSQSNISAGGDSVDYTDTIHPEFKEIAIKALNAIPGMEYAGIDFIAKDITQKPTKDNYILSEVEYSPAPLSQFPYDGIAYDLSGAIIDYYMERTGKK